MCKDAKSRSGGDHRHTSLSYKRTNNSGVIVAYVIRNQISQGTEFTRYLFLVALLPAGTGIVSAHAPLGVAVK